MVGIEREVPHFNVISRSTPEIVLSMKNLFSKKHDGNHFSSSKGLSKHVFVCL